MTEAARPTVSTIPAHRAFADALAAGLIRRHGRGPLDLAGGTILLPNARSARTVRDAFVRASAGGLILPRLVVIGDAELDEAVGLPLDAMDDAPLPPAIAPLARRMLLATALAERLPRGIGPAEAVRLAGALGAAIDTLTVEEVDPRALADLDVLPELQAHWQLSLGVFADLARDWPGMLAERGLIDLAERRNRLLNRVAKVWAERPPAGFLIAAGVETGSPAVARLLKTVAFSPRGAVVFAGLDLLMPDEEWDWLGEDRAGEAHPQFGPRRLLDRMDVARAEVGVWPHGGGADANERRGRLVASAFAPAPFTGEWFERVPAQARLNGVAAIECDTPAEEAQAVALLLRGALETPGRRAALVTPDRALARRVAAHLGRWGVEVDDSAGTPLAATPPGAFLRELAASVADRFAPLGLMAVLKHPLASGGLARIEWLAGARVLDLRLRGVRPPAGLAGIAARLGELPDGAAAVWERAREALAPLDDLRTCGAAAFAARFRAAAEALAGEALWSAPAGRALADWWDEVEMDAALLGRIAPADWPALLDSLLERRAVRPPQGGHPRLAILGLIEARLAHTDLMVAGGLNEGVWPALPAPDPWLAPRIRRELDLPSGERRIGLAAHDLQNLLGAPAVVLTRARRSEGAPTVASRFWLRLEAMSGGLRRDDATLALARALDEPDRVERAARPAPRPPATARPKRISVSDVDRLAADPYAFYAARVLRLAALAGLEEEPDAAWRGVHVHAILDAWHRLDGGDPDRLPPRARAFLDAEGEHPLLRALWEPRLLRSLEWVAGRLAAERAAGREVLATEVWARLERGGVALRGRIDRIDRLADGALGVVDYKTGGAPSAAMVRAGYALQLGLGGLLVRNGGVEGLAETVGGFEYWSFRRKGDEWGQIATPVDDKERYGRMRPDALVPHATACFDALAADYLTGEMPFVAKLAPQWTRGGDYDQLMRLEEWWGREADV